MIELNKFAINKEVLSYASYALHNWHRLDDSRAIELGNIALNQNFLGGQDEEWFILVHIDIEAKAGPLLQALCDACDAADAKKVDELNAALKIVKTALEKICETMDRMPERCDPTIYYQRVRPYIHGWKDNPALMNGLIYTGVERFQRDGVDQGQFFRGETGAQSGIIPCVDAVLKITHEDDPLRMYLKEMEDYMPKPHRDFLHGLQAHIGIRKFITACDHPESKQLYNDCIDLVDRFRQTHLHYAANYIQKQHQSSDANPTAVGTGGTPFMKYLKKHELETAARKLR